jgi:hemoglobin
LSLKQGPNIDFERLRVQIAKANKAFYDRVYQDRWLKLVFEGVQQEFIEKQQTDFMLAAFGGPNEFAGRNPNHAHPHIHVTEAMWQRRERYLIEAFDATDFPKEFRTEWLNIDEAFKSSIVKSSLAECQKRYTTDKIIDFPDPG